MSSIAGSTIVQEPSPVLQQRSDSFTTPCADPEAQTSPRGGRRPSGVRRETTTSSFDFPPAVNSRDGRRRSTRTSVDSGTPTLERKQTWRVEEEALDGYPKLASFLSDDNDHAIYKRFAALNSRNLLYHQAKLTRFEHELNELEKLFAHEVKYHHSVDHIFTATESGCEVGYALRMKYEEVSRALDKYNHLLLEQKQMHALPSPESSFVDSIYRFITSEKLPKPDWLAHPENTVYAVWDDDRNPIQKDLVSLNPTMKIHDPFTRFFTRTIVEWWHNVYSRFRGPNGAFDEHVYQNQTLDRIMNAIVLVVSSALPTSSIIALFFITSAVWRLIFIVIFSGVFASALAFFTEARRVEVFTASVALASVQVVFVGTAFGNGNNVST